MPMRPQCQQETANLILKKNNQSNHPHIHQGIEYGTQQFHFQDLRNDQPDQDKHQNAGKNLDRAGCLHQLVSVIQQQGNQQYIDKIFYANVKKHGIRSNYKLVIYLSFSTIRTASTASRTSCTRRMFAPFIKATVSSTVVPFKASCGVPPNSL